MQKTFMKYLFILPIVLLLTNGCSLIDDSSIDGQTQADEGIKIGKKAFLPEQNCDFEIIYFDTDNVVSNDGMSSTNVISDLSTSNNCSDCYLVKVGNTEILVDCGNQNTYGTGENTTRNFCTNIIKKIATYCTDGILEYLVVTHADTDHIKNLTIDGGLFDMFIDYDKWFVNYYKKYNSNDEKFLNIFNEETKPIKTLSNIIDFESYRVRYHSNPDNGNNLLLSTDIYKKYVNLRDKVINIQKSKYAPASYFFSQVSCHTTDPKGHSYYAIPNEYYDKVYGEKGKIERELYLKSLLHRDIYNSINNKKYNMPKLNGLNKIETANGYRYTYDININKNVKFKILYNWYYDNWYQGSFNSQDRNNISVCVMVESQNMKWLSLGDLGGNGESGLLNYYEGTDVLKNITSFKASHHGSVNNKENSKRLFDTITPENQKMSLIVTGVGQPTRNFLESKDIVSQNQSYYSSIGSVAIMSKELFGNIDLDKTNIYCTQIVATNDNKKFYNTPFYGDIHVTFKGVESKVCYSYGGDINTYIPTENKDSYQYSFNTIVNSSILTVTELLWFEAVGLK